MRRRDRELGERRFVPGKGISHWPAIHSAVGLFVALMLTNRLRAGRDEE